LAVEAVVVPGICMTAPFHTNMLGVAAAVPVVIARRLVLL
jgi:hypothetical protein